MPPRPATASSAGTGASRCTAGVGDTGGAEEATSTAAGTAADAVAGAGLLRVFTCAVAGLDSSAISSLSTIAIAMRTSTTKAMIKAVTGPTTLPPAPQWRRHRLALWVVLATLGAVVGATAAVAALWTVPYVMISPGSVWPTEELVEVEGAETFTSEGQIGFTTVSLSSQRTSALEAFFGWLDPAVDVVDEDLILGDDTPDENRSRQLQFMQDSKQLATAVALETLGYEVTVALGARVLEVDPNLPAAGVLEVGDIIVGIDGEEIDNWAQVVDAIATHAPGDEISLEVERPTRDEPGDEPEDDPPAEHGSDSGAPDEPGGSAGDGGVEQIALTVSLGARSEDPSKAILGIVGTDAIEFDFPFTVELDTGDVGGPSAGLAMTLAVLDVLTPEDLTAGSLVATTGTINIDGTVGPVGGVEQKTVAARRAGVDLFLVPTAEYDEATSAAGPMTVVAVDTLEEALGALEQVGADTAALQSSAQTALGG